MLQNRGTGRKDIKEESKSWRYLRKIEGKTKMDKIRDKTYRKNLKTKALEVLIEERKPKWFGHVRRMRIRTKNNKKDIRSKTNKGEK